MNKVFYQKLGKSMQDARIQRGLTQQEVADRMYVTRSAVGFWELGKRAINMDDLFKYCDVLNVDVNDIVAPVRKYTYKK